MSNGVVYIITQDSRYRDLLLTSVASLKRVMPHLPVTVFSQFPIESNDVDKVVFVEPTKDGFYDKARLIRKSPYQRTLFVDADIFVAEAFPELFSLLDRFDVAATHEEYLSTDWSRVYPRIDVPTSFPEFNTGILLIKRSEKTDRLLAHWSDLYQKFLEENPNKQINDQPFFRVAAYYSDVRIATLTREYNCKFRGQGYLNGPVKILHGHDEYRLDAGHVGKAIGVLNASHRPRVYIAGEVYEQTIVGRLVGQRKAHKVGSFPELPGSILLRRAKRLREVVRERGVSKTLAKVFTVK